MYFEASQCEIGTVPVMRMLPLFIIGTADATLTLMIPDKSKQTKCSTFINRLGPSKFQQELVLPAAQEAWKRQGMT